MRPVPSLWRIVRTDYTASVGVLVPLVVIAVVTLAAWLTLSYLRAWLAITGQWRESKGAGLIGEVGSVGITYTDTPPGVLTPWDAFLKAHLRDDLIVLVGVDGLATVLPRHFFASENGWQSARQLVEFNVVAPK